MDSDEMVRRWSTPTPAKVPRGARHRPVSRRRFVTGVVAAPIVMLAGWAAVPRGPRLYGHDCCYGELGYGE